MKCVFDIDDTIIFSEIDKNGNYSMKSWDRFLVKKINELYNKGNEIILWTGRHWNHLLITKNQLKKIGLKYHTLLMGKPVADFYVDDKGMKPIEFMNLKNI